MIIWNWSHKLYCEIEGYKNFIVDERNIRDGGLQELEIRYKWNKITLIE